MKGKRNWIAIIFSLVTGASFLLPWMIVPSISTFDGREVMLLAHENGVSMAGLFVLFPITAALFLFIHLVVPRITKYSDPLLILLLLAIPIFYFYKLQVLNQFYSSDLQRGYGVYVALGGVIVLIISWIRSFFR
jgi:hypothetical protein